MVDVSIRYFFRNKEFWRLYAALVHHPRKLSSSFTVDLTDGCVAAFLALRFGW